MRTFGGIGEDIYTQLDPHLFSQHFVLLTAGISYAAIASWSSILEHRGERYDMCILTAPRLTENRDVQRLLHPIGAMICHGMVIRSSGNLKYCINIHAAWSEFVTMHWPSRRLRSISETKKRHLA